MKLPGVRPSVCRSVRLFRPVAAPPGFLLCAQSQEYIDKLLLGRRLAATTPQRHSTLLIVTD